MIKSFLADYDYNLPFRDAEDDPDLSARRRTMAAIGCHVGLNSGYFDAQALAGCLLDMAREQNDGVPVGQGDTRNHLEDLLRRDHLGYQKALYRLVAMASAADAAADLVCLTELMRQRADMALPLHAMGLKPELPNRQHRGT
jgi:hypothetical protein